ncbi:hypothetical protein PIIN_08477 [Serendipita indica DSM 11827]|uniref:Uncharacterized protein n=1 Tax=Serendipita indica (strain DSM 11827) TaxID=1109443 RepID=G4TT82_SERID|nr:hypothetical protein PIIN_08477 [Serendipita indica DSM 11827]
MFASSLARPIRLARILPLGLQKRAFTVSTTRRLDDARLRRQVDAIYDEGNYYFKVREKEILEPEKTVFLLEEIIERHKTNFHIAALSSSAFGVFMTLATTYIHELWRLQRTVAATNFMRQFLTIVRERAAAEIQYADSQVVMALSLFYTLLRESNGDPRERWDVIKEAKELCERIVPLAWDPNAPASLKDQRAKLLQLYALEHDLLLSDPRTRKFSVGSLVDTHKQILLLQEGKNNDMAQKVRMTSLRTICQLEEERGRHNQYLPSAKRFFDLADATYRAGVAGKKISADAVYDKIFSYILLCKAHRRPFNAKEIIAKATEGLELINDVRDLPSPAEASQLLVLRSQSHLRQLKPDEALSDARTAVQVVDDGNWSIIYQLENCDPTRYKKYHWKNLCMANLCDILFDNKVTAPEEQSGLLVARAGRAMNKKLGDANWELRFRIKELGALRRLRRWNDALGQCVVLLDKIADLFPSSGKEHLDLEGHVVIACEDAAECLEKLGHQPEADELIEEADAFTAYTEQEDATLEDYAIRARAISAKLRSIVQRQVPQAIEEPSLFKRFVST